MGPRYGPFIPCGLLLSLSQGELLTFFLITALCMKEFDNQLPSNRLNHAAETEEKIIKEKTKRDQRFYGWRYE